MNILSIIFYLSIPAKYVSSSKSDHLKLDDLTKTREQILTHDLFHKKRYDKRIRPATPYLEPVEITFRLDLYQILENEPQQSLTINAWVEEDWYDMNLYWDPEKYDNLTELTIPHDNIWLPDTVLYNSITMKDDDVRRLLNARIKSDVTRKSARVEVMYPTIYTFSCRLNILSFPFDTQNCSLWFGSWTHDASELDYFAKHGANAGLANYLPNEGWLLVSFTTKRHQFNYSCCPNPYTNIEFSLCIQRKPLFYIVNLIVPTCIITMISLVGFFTPSNADGERNEKMTLGITTLLSMSILLLMISDQIPTTSNYVPLIGQFYLTMIVLISFGTLVSSMVIVLQRHGEMGKRLSPVMVKIVNALSCILFVERPEHLKMEEGDFSCFDWWSVKGFSKSDLPMEGVKHAPLVSPEQFDITQRDNGQNCDPVLVPLVSNTSISSVGSSGKKVKNAAMEPNHSRQSYSKNSTIFMALEEWRWLATVVERCALITFLCTLFFLSIGFLFHGWHNAKLVVEQHGMQG